MSEKPSDKALQEFLSEAQEIAETLNRDLLGLDAQRAHGTFDPETLNDAFRAVHSLKGLSAMFGATRMASLSHALESLLDSLRLGRVPLTPRVLDLLFEAVELYGRLVAEVSAGRDGAAVDVDGYLGRLRAAAAEPPPAAVAATLADYDLDAGVLSVLTEYEEHRLKENIRQGRALHRVHAGFDLLTIDKGLEALKARLKPLGEVITYLPSSETADDARIELDILLGSDLQDAAVAAGVEGLAVSVAQVPRRARVARSADPAAPPATPAPAPSVPPAPWPVRPPALRAPEPAEPTRAAAGAAEGAGDEGASIKSVSQTVRVDIRKLDHLMNVVGELALARAGVTAVLEELRQRDPELARDLHREARALERKLAELQAGILEVRMVPLGQMFDKLSRVVRKISRDEGKDIRLRVEGADTELDKLIVEELSDPLMHIIRNSIDHGIEDAETRRLAGKPAEGTISIRARQKGNHVILEVADDGAGFDEDGILETALGRGLLSTAAAAELTRRELLNLVFLPGFSTRATATEISGRGVGMDVVKTNIARLSGMIDVRSARGKGAALTITLPITLAIIQALVIRVAGRTYAVPLGSVLESLAVEREDLRTIEGREVITLRGQTLPLLRPDALFGLARDGAPPDRQYVVVVGLAQHRLGLVVDDLTGQQDIVVKSLGKALSGIPGIAGATELGGQQTVLVLDVASLVEEAVRAGLPEAA